MLEDFFLELDERWKPVGIEPIRLPIIGCSALLLQINDFYRGTKDSDVLELGEISQTISKLLLKLAGPNTTIAKRRKCYLDMVQPAVPFLPPRALFHPLHSLTKHLKNFQVEALDIADVVVSKLKPFRAGDLDDINELVRLNLVSPRTLVERFSLAKESWLMDSRASHLPKLIENLNTILRDAFGVQEVTFALPHWIET